jgi:hypothetical protein
MVCPVCAEESDGFEGRNGFSPQFADERTMCHLEGMPRHLPAPIWFQILETGEPSDVDEYADWKQVCVNAKIGGRQLAFQSPRIDPRCPVCDGPALFIGSLDSDWAPDHLNFGGGMGYLFACSKECAPLASFFYWDCA